MIAPEKIIYPQDFKEEDLYLDNIFLDPNNPRFFVEERILPDNRIVEDSIQKSCIEKMQQFDIEDLEENIKRVGFLPIDKVVVRPILRIKNKYVVVEGNRRIAALKLLKTEYDNGEIQLTDDILNSILKFKTLVYTGKEKDIAWIVQGIRHISGIKDWPPYQQAKLLAKLIEEKNIKIEDAAKSVGIGPHKASKLLRSYYAYQQSLNDEEFGEFIDQDKFSFFQEAIFPKIRTPLQDWIGWDDKERRFKSIENLRKFLSWIIEYEGKPARIPRAIDARDILSKVLSQYPDIFKKFETRSDLTIDDLRHEIWKIEEAPKEVDEWLETLKELINQLENLPDVKIKISKKKSEAVELLNKMKRILTEHLKTLEE